MTRIALAGTSLQTCLRRALVVGCMFALLAATALAPAPAFAQKKKDTVEEKPPKSYTMPYFLSAVAVLLVVAPLCLPMMRPVEAPKDEDD